jgi:hypothetical protein
MLPGSKPKTWIASGFGFSGLLLDRRQNGDLRMRKRSPAYELLLTEFAVVLICMIFNADNGLRHVGQRLMDTVRPRLEQPAQRIDRVEIVWSYAPGYDHRL